MNIKVPWTSNKSKRLFLEIMLNFSIVLLMIMMNMLFFTLLDLSSSDVEDVLSIEDIKSILRWIVVSLVISFMIISINTMTYLISNWISIATEMSEQKLKTAELKQASAEAELHALKLQLDPHFIFNNLSVLSELILEDQQIGFEYSENFAKVYRFLLLNSKKNIITLDEEINFLNAYIFLITHRIGSGVHFTIKINEHSKYMYIPSLTLQLLIENAIKHNKTSRKEPLNINISNPEVGLIIVENTLSPIENTKNISTGIGLNNIISRYKLLGKKVPEVIKDKLTFKVSIQLIEYDKENSNS
ncbi:sensor histidine kinase [Sphingobacterium sp. JUb78]|uniref:sensor histidine kinase n=1 Tax=Sphingobacterium sp. JUb78 TaxID=2485111 RepID=UPI001FB4B4CC|nr:histidine kinase [Sphingobacterium sp. JUb78]